MTRLAVFASFAGAVLVACMPMAEMPQPEEGRALFAENCALCHGPSGRGDGEVARDLGLRPPDLTAIAARNDGTFPRAEVLSTIDGYTKRDMPGHDMPEFGALLMAETVPVDTGDGVMSPVPRPMAALMIYLESIQK
ncbi:MAG: c-type cytochrome [Paracoccaceae bacterium]